MSKLIWVTGIVPFGFFFHLIHLKALVLEPIRKLQNVIMIDGRALEGSWRAIGNLKTLFYQDNMWCNSANECLSVLLTLFQQENLTHSQHIWPCTCLTSASLMSCISVTPVLFFFRTDIPSSSSYCSYPCTSLSPQSFNWKL